MPKSAKIHLRRFGRPGESAPSADSNQQLSECRRLVQADLIAPPQLLLVWAEHRITWTPYCVDCLQSLEEIGGLEKVRQDLDANAAQESPTGTVYPLSAV